MKKGASKGNKTLNILVFNKTNDVKLEIFYIK